MGASPLIVTVPAYPGGTFQVVPDLPVVDIGTDAARSVLTMERLSQGYQTTVPARWVVFGADRFVLAPNARRTLPLRAVPLASATPGAYTSDVVATGVIPHGTGQAAVGAAAATTISCTVAASPSSTFPWTALVIVAGILVLVALVAIRRAGLGLKVERR